MKWAVFLLCLLFGHNTILGQNNKNGHIVYYTVCSQCGKKWSYKEFNKKIQFKIYRIKMAGHGQKMLIENIPQTIVNTPKINFYIL